MADEEDLDALWNGAWSPSEEDASLMPMLLLMMKLLKNS